MAEYFDMEAGGGTGYDSEPSDLSGSETPATNQQRGKHYDYVFTLNNYTADEIIFLRAFAERECKYLVYQHEIGESGTPHLQGFMQFKSRRHFGGVRKKLTRNGRCRFFIDPRRGSLEQAIEYATRESKRDIAANPDIFEHGTRPAGRGTRSDIRNCVSDVQQGRRARDLFDQHPEVMVRYSRGIAAARMVYESKRNFKTIVKWYYGSTGTGKSRAAYNEAGDDAYWKAGATKWWCGYDGQETVVIDDYRLDLCPFHVLLRMFDRYPLSVEGKGTTMQFTSKIIIVTAPHRPENMWRSRVAEDIQQLLRRIDEIKLFGEEPEFNPDPNPVPTFNH